MADIIFQGEKGRQSFTKLTVLLFATVCVVAIYVDARKCWACVGEDDCKKPATQNCPANIKGCATVRSGDYPYFAKGCAIDSNGNDPGLKGCFNGTNVDGTTITVCECSDKDLCNDKDVNATQQVVLPHAVHFGRRQMAVNSKVRSVWNGIVKKN